MPRFVIETSDKMNFEQLKEVIFKAEMVGAFSIYPVQEENKRADGKIRLTTKQRDALWDICGRYNVPFSEADYPVYEGHGLGVHGMAEGWVGGPLRNGHNNMGKTIYVGVTPDGRINS